MTMNFNIGNVLNLQAMSGALNQAISSKLGIIFPTLLIQWAAMYTNGMINIGGGTPQQLANAAVQAFFQTWAVLTITSTVAA